MSRPEFIQTVNVLGRNVHVDLVCCANCGSRHKFKEFHTDTKFSWFEVEETIMKVICPFGHIWYISFRERWWGTAL